MKILVTGATGNVGAHVVRGLRERGMDMRALVRDQMKAALVLGQHVELAIGDFADRESLDRALHGVDAVFLACGNVPGQIDYERAAIDAAKAAQVKRIVKLSGPDAAVDSLLVFERWHGEIERHLLSSGVPWVLLRPSAYMTNLLAYADTVAKTGRLFAPAGTARIAYIDPRDVADAAVATLVGPAHEGKTYKLTGPEAITFAQIAQALSNATGRAIDYVDVPDDVARHSMIEAGLPPMVAEAIVDVFGSYRAGSQARTTDAVRELTGREPRPIDQFAREYAVMFGTPQRAVAS